jgi:hypothetical protein
MSQLHMSETCDANLFGSPDDEARISLADHQTFTLALIEALQSEWSSGFSAV